MKTLSFTFVLVFGSFLQIFAQYKPSDILLTVNNQPVTVREFERVYEKNRNIDSLDKQSVDQYFDLFVRFKLKVAAARAAGIDTLTSFRKEFKSYRDQLAKTYLTDNAEIDSLMKEAYRRMVTEVKVSHIMVKLPDSPTAEDTLKAYQKIMEIRKRVISGEPFDKVAGEVSEDPSAKTNHGNLGYFSAFRFPYSFECESYNTKPGDISMPFRTRFGYHIVKVTDRRLSPGEVKVAHIMIAVPQGSSEEKWNEAKERIDKIYDRLKNGEDFGTLAKELSDDKNSGRNNGELPWFGTGRMVPEFEEAAFSLKTPGSISEPVKTFFGWHIIKLIDKRGIPPYDLVKNELKSKIMLDERYELVNRSFINKLKQTCQWKEFRENLTCFYQLDSSVYKGKFNLNKGCDLKLPLVSIEGDSFSVENFKKFLTANHLPKEGFPIKEFIDASYNKFVDNAFLQYEDRHLDQKYPEFHYLTREYYDGILLYDIMDREVWGKASRDSAGLEAYFKGVSDKYMWGKRLDATVYYCANQEIARKARKIVEKAGNRGTDDDQLIKEVCDTTKDCLKIDHKLFSKGDSPLVDSIAWEPGVTKLINRNNQTVFVKVTSIHQPEPKKLDEVRGLVMAGYQNALEDQWVAKLRDEFKVEVNQDLLHKIEAKYTNNQ